MQVYPEENYPSYHCGQHDYKCDASVADARSISDFEAFKLVRHGMRPGALRKPEEKRENCQTALSQPPGTYYVRHKPIRAAFV